MPDHHHDREISGASSAPAAPKRRRNWKRIQPTSLRQALELCKDHAREVRNMSVERIAEAMGITDHWTVYKWLQTGRIPFNLVPPFEAACGINFCTRWLAASQGKLLIDIPTGRNVTSDEIAGLHTSFGDGLKLLSDFYAGIGDQAATVEALTHHLQQVAWHRRNVTAHSEPELEL